MTLSNDNLQDEKLGACPICKSTAKKEYAPFCSKRCADVDLHRWLSGSYAIPAAEEDDSAEDRESAE